MFSVSESLARLCKSGGISYATGLASRERYNPWDDAPKRDGVSLKETIERYQGTMPTSTLSTLLKLALPDI